MRDNLPPDKLARGRQNDLHNNTVRRRVRAAVVWTYVVAVISACLAYAVRDWDAAQMKWIVEWGLLFLSPALLAASIQNVRRRMSVAELGQLIRKYPAQRTAKLPKWVIGFAFLIFAAAPFSVLLFRDGHVLLVVAFAFAGILLFSMIWLWFDGIALELRERGLLVDGLHRIEWRMIGDASSVKRTNVIQLELVDESGEVVRPTEIFVCAEDRSELISEIEQRVADDSLNSHSSPVIYQHDEI